MSDNPTGAELVMREATDTWVDVMRPVQALSDYIARTDFTPKSMRGNAPAVAAAILTGRELGLGPMTSLRSLDVIEGSVQMKTKAILARIFAAGHRVEWIESSSKACEVRIERADGLSDMSVRWTMADAQQAELAGKAVWRRYPRAMLRNRALSECAELVCPDVILGMEAGDGDMSDAEPRQAPTVVQVTSTTGAAPVVIQYPAAPSTVAAEPVEAELVDPGPTPAAEEPQEAPEPLVTPAQMRKIGALIGEWETVEGRKLDRDERRRMIGFMAGVPDPDALESAKSLTVGQASTAIEALVAEIAASRGTSEAEVVYEDPPE